MTDDRSDHLIIIQASLAQLSGGPYEIQRYELLSGGVSGAYTYRLSVGVESLILKVTLATSGPTVRARADREIAFYQSLAEQLPIATPQLLASYSDKPSGSALLLPSYQESPAPSHWGKRDYIEVARQVAQLHAAYWDSAQHLAHLGWLRQHDDNSDIPLVAVEQAWQPLWARPDVPGATRADSQKLLARGLRQLAQLRARLQAFPTTLCHGDCHIGNLLRDAEGRLIWADWQEVGIGRGPQDLSFFVQRAMAAGGAVPEAHMLAAYQAQLASAIGVSIPIAELQRVMDAFELRTRLIEWLAYLVHAPAGQILSHMARIELLLARLHSAMQ